MLQISGGDEAEAGAQTVCGNSRNRDNNRTGAGHRAAGVGCAKGPDPPRAHTAPRELVGSVVDRGGASETTAKGTGLAESAGKEDPVELDSSLAL
ncbi:hypothetical protein DPEC_G00331480 [Dallia pectoralis]|uniref:Uncharacterized protein n=1 Tax=Dallia pectoralis TaxID=75939 RepID=A0ACC2F624_DALPE|nr:hypothetical protein DPEC_G00331480 [Dallia pectoralis]